jgi:hypothetical protein
MISKAWCRIDMLYKYAPDVVSSTNPEAGPQCSSTISITLGLPPNEAKAYPVADSFDEEVKRSLAVL